MLRGEIVVTKGAQAWPFAKPSRRHAALGDAHAWHPGLLVSLPEAYPELRLELLGGLLLAGLLGGAIGWEREHAHKPAGLRTNILICMAATLLIYLSVLAASSSAVADPGRIAAQIVTGMSSWGRGRSSSPAVP
jgi:hypothetical protein